MSLLRFQHLKNYPRKRLPRDPRTKLPIPHVHDIHVAEWTPTTRWEDYYATTLKHNLMYMTYHHEPHPRESRTLPRLKYDPEDPFTKNRPNPRIGGNRFQLKNPLPPDSPHNIIKLESLQLHIFEHSAITNRNNLMGPIMALRALSGETENGVPGSNSGVRITKGKSVVNQWSMRKGIPVGALVDLKGQPMWDFIASLTEFVLPRLRDFQGFPLRPPHATLIAPHAVSGVVSLGLPKTVMGYFPQIEVNLDSYPRMYGVWIHFRTNAKGINAENRARALLSGLQIPFTRAS